eukprot:g5998.t1
MDGLKGKHLSHSRIFLARRFASLHGANFLAILLSALEKYLTRQLCNPDLNPSETHGDTDAGLAKVAGASAAESY